MMDVICDSMLIAARIGAQVGRDMQVDQAINSWKQHADALELQRNAAWRQIESKNALLKEYDEHEDKLIAKLTALRKENARLTEESKREARLKNAYKDQLAVQTKKLEKAQAAATTNEKCAKVLQQRIEELKKAGEGERSRWLDLWRVENLRLQATWARLAGVERVLGRLIAEIVDRVPNIQFEMLVEEKRKAVLLKAWIEVAQSKARYDPCLRFTFTPLPI
jgi:chromosome segregation ATPase